MTNRDVQDVSVQPTGFRHEGETGRAIGGAIFGTIAVYFDLKSSVHN